MSEWHIEEARYKTDRFDPERVAFMLCKGDRRVARLDDHDMAERIVAALSAQEREARLVASIRTALDELIGRDELSAVDTLRAALAE